MTFEPARAQGPVSSPPRTSHHPILSGPQTQPVSNPTGRVLTALTVEAEPRACSLWIPSSPPKSCACKAAWRTKVAKAIVTACTRLLAPSFAELATKSDVEQCRAETKAEWADLKTDIVAIKTEMASVKATMATKAELAHRKAELLTWMVSVIVAHLVAMVSLFKLLTSRALMCGPSSPLEWFVTQPGRRDCCPLTHHLAHPRAIAPGPKPRRSPGVRRRGAPSRHLLYQGHPIRHAPTLAHAGSCSSQPQGVAEGDPRGADSLAGQPQMPARTRESLRDLRWSPSARTKGTGGQESSPQTRGEHPSRCPFEA
jgi:hypothetical protein